MGDPVIWRGGWGNHPPKIAHIEGMEVTELPRKKYGDEVDEVDVSLIKENRVVFTLTNGSWCYSDQIEIRDG